MKYYIMTSLSRRAEHNYVRDQLNALGHEITCDWTVPLEHLEDPYEARLQEAFLAEMAAKEMEGGVCAADFCVALLPGGRGTHTEFGAALALRKPLIVHDGGDLRLPGRNRCSFYFHPGIQVWLSGHLDIVANYVKCYAWHEPKEEKRWLFYRVACGRVGSGWFIEAREDPRDEWQLWSEDVSEDGYFGSVGFKPDGSIDWLELSKDTMRAYLNPLTEEELRAGLLDLGRALSDQ